MTRAKRLRREGFKIGFAIGFVIGRYENQREAVVKLLSRRFGALPAMVEDRIRGAKFNELDRWFDRGLIAPSLDAVFADET